MCRRIQLSRRLVSRDGFHLETLCAFRALMPCFRVDNRPQQGRPTCGLLVAASTRHAFHLTCSSLHHEKAASRKTAALKVSVVGQTSS